jgi:signal transduction histidine kinase
MFANSQALSRASHELRTPLNAILGFGQLLALDELDESQRHNVEQIMAGGRHLLALIEDLLDVSRLDAAGLDLGPVDTAAQIEGAVALCQPLAAGESLTVTVDTGAEPLWALADARRLKQVLLNLISNAIKYNRAGGSVTIRARPDGADGVRIDVIDSGVGMSYQQLTRLFQPFERLDAPVRGIEGNGLGLAVSRSLVEAMNGTIDVASNPGAGSVFSVRLLAAEAVPVVAVSAVAHPAVAFSAVAHPAAVAVSAVAHPAAAAPGERLLQAA